VCYSIGAVDMIFKIPRERGFTLVELLVVIAMIGLLSTIGVVALNQARAKARDAKVLSHVNQIAKMLEIYNSAKNKYPKGNLDLAGAIVMDNGCMSEKQGVTAAATGCTAADGVLLNPIPTAPVVAEPYRYRSYQVEARNLPTATGGSAAACTNEATQQCLSFGIQFSLETTVAGLKVGKHCMTNTGILGDPQSELVCPSAI